MSKIKTTRSSGNVFADIGFQNSEELSIKAQLVGNLQRLMKLCKLTQKEVAERVGTDQPAVSKLLHWHSALNQEVDITIRDRFTRRPSQKARRGHVSVRACACPA